MTASYPDESMDEALTSTPQAFGLGEGAAPAKPSSASFNPLNLYRSYIAERLAPIMGADKSVIQNAIQRTQSSDKGDLVLPVAALRLKGRKPGEVARDIQEKFHDPHNIINISKTPSQAPYIQFTISPTPLANLILPTILTKDSQYGFDNTPGLKDPSDPNSPGKRIIIEFGSPNIARPFHQGHLRSTILGAFLANLYEKAGWNVIRMNYLGDWGKQYGVLGIGFEEFGEEEKLQTDPIGHLFDVYVRISTQGRKEQDRMQMMKDRIEFVTAQSALDGAEDWAPYVDNLEKDLAAQQAKCVDERARGYFKSLSDKEPDVTSLWQRFRALSIKKYKETFARLNITYDIYTGESQISEESMETAATLLTQQGLSFHSQGATIVDLTPQSKKLGKAIVRKKDGTSIYMTRDIGAVFERYSEYNYDKMIYVIASQQDLHMAQLIKIIELIGRPDLSEKLEHVNFGLVKGMSTRRGTVKFLDDILRDAGERMHEVMKGNEAKYAQIENPEKIADILGISAVLVQDMNSKRINGYTFDMDRMTSFEGDTGPYLQYSHARLCSILRKAKASSPLDVEELQKANFALLNEPHAKAILVQLFYWPEIFSTTYHKTREPVTVLSYLWKLTHAVNSSYDHLNVLNAETEVKVARLALYSAARQVLGSAMKLLGLSPVER
ncbi:uncharacterized protein BDV14DRAFT_211577 [Aspergillus stella-maris]|uniref:uncharacterized protein n=1 Tax=Aspergillus stella-maris TaxID=1810926 RepID=UPI003CCD9F67